VKLIVAPTRAHAKLHAQNEGWGERQYIHIAHASQLDALRGGTLVILGYPFGRTGSALREAVAGFRQRHAAHAEVHIGRSWTGTRLEDDCPCPKAPCGLVIRDQVDPNCAQHALTACKTIRQIHSAEDCRAT